MGGINVDMNGKVAVVTGSTSGIGRAIADLLAEAGATVVILGRDAERARAVAKEIGSGATGYGVDISQNDSVLRMRDEVMARFGTVPLLVNNAGLDRYGAFLDNEPAVWPELIDVNYLGPVQVTHAFLQGMVDAGGGRIVNVSSDAGRVGNGGETVYAGTKGAMISFTKSLAREVAQHDITVNCVCPGPTRTPLFDANIPIRKQEALARATPMRRIAVPEDVAGAVLFFASELASFITGQVLSTSGGLTMVD